MASAPPQSSCYCIGLDDVKAAAHRIDGTAHRTPLLTCSSLNELASPNSDGEKLGRQFFFKVEAMQKTGSFKFRGALNAIRCMLGETSRSNGSTSDPGTFSVVTHSSGNFAQALALAAKLSSTATTKVNATIVMPRSAPVVKKKAVEAFGGRIVLTDNTNQAREDEADRIVANTGGTFVHPSEDPRVIAGQGTAGLELVEQLREMVSDELDAVIIPVGGGGLASGNTICLRGLLQSKVKIILAEPAQLDDAKRSFESGQHLKHAADNDLNSVADGLKTTLGPNTWPIVRDLVDDILTVTEEEILRATKLVWERLKVCIEPSSGVSVAVALSQEFATKYPVDAGIRNVGVILSGGNVDILKMASLMQEMGL